MNAALAALRSMRRATSGGLDIARRAHSALVAECNAQIEASVAVVNAQTAALDELDQAIELLELAQ